MTFRRNLIFAGLALAGLAFLAPDGAQAASIQMCSPGQTSGAQARQVTNPTTNVTYSLDSKGCADIGSGDIGYFASQGFVNRGGGTFGQVFTQQTTGFQFTLPLSAFIRNIIGHEGTGNATNSGICIGTTSGGSDVATLLGTGSTLKAVSDASMAKRVLSTTAATAVFVNSCVATGFGTSIWDFTIEFGYF